MYFDLKGLKLAIIRNQKMAETCYLFGKTGVLPGTAGCH
jgi:hypothetical protein